MNELIGSIVAFVLTLAIYSYILGDNVFYRLAVHLLVGVSAGYALVVAVGQVLWPTVQLLRGDLIGQALWFVPLVLGLLLLLSRFAPGLEWLGKWPLALMLGVGAVVSLLGAVGGTLVPQATAVGPTVPWLGNFTLVLTAFLTICVLLYFRFNIGTEENPAAIPQWQQVLGGGIGRGVIMITLGALFAGILSSSLTILTESVADLVVFIQPFLP